MHSSVLSIINKDKFFLKMLIFLATGKDLMLPLILFLEFFLGM